MSARLLRRVGILGTGSYVPERVLSNFDFERMVDTSDEWIFTRTGMRERRIAAPEQATSDLCAEAARRAMSDAEVTADQIGLAVVATVTPDHLVPSTSCLVQTALGLKHAAAMDMNVACSGFVSAIGVAASMIAAGRVDRALVMGGECMSRIVNYQDRRSCILFGDGAGAVVLAADAPQGEILDSTMGADGSGAASMILPAGGSRRPVDHEAVDQNLHRLVIRGNEVFKFAVGKFRELLLQQMRKFEFGPEDFGLVVPHQVNYRIIESALKKLEIPEERIFMNLERYGNTSAASVAIALDEARRAGRIPKDKYLSLIAFGAGLTWASALLRW